MNQMETAARAAPDEGDDSRLAELVAGWLPLLTAFVGVATCVSVITGHTAGVFILSLSHAFGWSRTELSLGAMIGGIITAIASPIVGQLVDRYGPRPVAATSIVGAAASFLVMAQFVHTLPGYLLTVATISVIGAGATVVSYIALINLWFVRARGLAIGIVMAGTGVTAIVMPPLMIPYVLGAGWQAGYRVLAVIMLLTLPLILIGAGRPSSERRAAANAQGMLWGPTLTQAQREGRFWRQGAAFFLMAASLGGLFVHFVPMLSDEGFGAATLASVTSLFGVAVLAGRLIAGYLLDRCFAPRLAVLFICFAMVGVVTLHWPMLPLIYVAAALVGLAFGTELDIAGYMTARYFGTRAYGAIYGWQYGMFIAGAIVSPLLYGVIHDRAGSYQPALLASLVLLAPAIPLFLSLGRYSQEGEA